MTPEPPGDAAGELRREAGRVADRLRVLGPRWAARRNDADAAAVTAVREALQELADLAAASGGAERHAVPDLAPHALGDQVLVLAHEAADAGAAAPARDVLIALRRAL